MSRTRNILRKRLTHKRKTLKGKRKVNKYVRKSNKKNNRIHRRVKKRRTRNTRKRGGSAPQQRKANFYDIANDVTPDYNDMGYITNDMYYGYSEPDDNDVYIDIPSLEVRITNYLNTHPNIQNGDIVYIGNTNIGEQEMGYGIVKNGTVLTTNLAGTLEHITTTPSPENINVVIRDMLSDTNTERDFQYTLNYTDAGRELYQHLIHNFL